MNDSRALLAAAESVLRHDLAEHAKGDLRYKALLCANAVAMVGRELALAEASRAAAIPGVTPQDIRAGKHDGDDATAQAALREAAMRAHVANPEALTRAERDTYLPQNVSQTPQRLS